MTAPLQYTHKLEQVQGWIDQGNFGCAICEMALLPQAAEDCPEAYDIRVKILWWLGKKREAIDLLVDAFDKWPMVPVTSLRLAVEIACGGLDSDAYEFLRRNYPEPIDEWLLRYLVAAYSLPKHYANAFKQMRICYDNAPDKDFLHELTESRPELAPILRIIREDNSKEI